MQWTGCRRLDKDFADNLSANRRPVGHRVFSGEANGVFNSWWCVRSRLRFEGMDSFKEKQMKPDTTIDKPERTLYEKVERIVFLLALIVFLCDLLWWRP